MSYFAIGPDEKIILQGKGVIEQPVSGKGEIYLTSKRVIMIHKSGLIRKRETPLVDVRLDNISYAKAEGLLRKVLVLGVHQGGLVTAFKIRVSNPESWVAQIYNLKSQVPDNT